MTGHVLSQGVGYGIGKKWKVEEWHIGNPIVNLCSFTHLFFFCIVVLHYSRWLWCFLCHRHDSYNVGSEAISSRISIKRNVYDCSQKCTYRFGCICCRIVMDMGGYSTSEFYRGL